MPDSILTFDLGTTRLKVALYSIRGRLLGMRDARHDEHRAGEFTWQSADSWWSDAVRLTRDLLGAKPCNIVAVSLSGRGNAAIFVGRNGEVIGDPWSDLRHARELQDLVQWRRGGYNLSNYAMALLAKRQWFVANGPTKARGLRHVLYGKDFLLFRLTGLAVTDWTSGPDAPQWDPRALDHTDTPASQVPRPALPWEIAGEVTRDAALALGVPAGTPVVVGAHDGICANVGCGAGGLGSYAITLGTHAVVRTVQAELPTRAYRFYGLPPDRHVIGGNGLMGGRAADWFLDLVFGTNDRARRRHFNAMDRAAAAVEDGADGVRFLPFLAGRVAPDRRPGARAAFVGLDSRHDRATLYRAVLEGTAFAVRDIFEQIVGWCGMPQVVRLSGSGARSAVWCELLANILDASLEVSDDAVEGRGAAIFAAVALGLHADYDAAARAMVHIRHRYEPTADRVRGYQSHHRDWCVAVDANRATDR